MRKQWFILFFVILAVLVLVRLFPRTASVESYTSSPEAIDLPVIQSNLTAYTYSPSNERPTSVIEPSSFTDRLFRKINPAWLEKYEGSHTLDEIKSAEGSSTLNINSSWLLRNSNAPRAGVLFQKDSTDTYRMSGGELYLPESGMGISYEKDAETGETKTSLHLKKEF